MLCNSKKVLLFYIGKGTKALQGHVRTDAFTTTRKHSLEKKVHKSLYWYPKNQMKEKLPV